MIILKLEFQSSTTYIFENIFIALLVAVVIQFMVQIVQYCVMKTKDYADILYLIVILFS